MMTKEELEKEVEDRGVEYADSIGSAIPKFSDNDGYSWLQVEEAYEKGALDFAEPLMQQNEKMKSLLKEIYEEFGFGELEHRYVAKTIFKCDEEDLEEKGYIKITFSIFNHQRKVIACKRPTQAQQDFLDSQEFNENRDDIWIGGV